MKNFFGKIFGSSKKELEKDDALNLVGDVLQTLIEISGLKLSFDLEKDTSEILRIDFFGEDEEMLTDKDGQLLDAFQLYLKRVVQHQWPEERTNIVVDCDGFREKMNESLINLAEKLKGLVVSKGKPVYFRALPPRDRQVIHQYLAEDDRIRSRSVGDGLYKKIKISLTKDSSLQEEVNYNR